MVTVQPGLCIYCTDRMKTQSLRASGPSRSDFQWPDAVTVQLAELLQKMSETHQMERPSDEFFVFLREIAAVQPDARRRCTDPMKTQSLQASGPSRSDFQWPDAILVSFSHEFCINLLPDSL